MCIHLEKVLAEPFHLRIETYCSHYMHIDREKSDVYSNTELTDLLDTVFLSHDLEYFDYVFLLYCMHYLDFECVHLEPDTFISCTKNSTHPYEGLHIQCKEDKYLITGHLGNYSYTL